MNPAPTPLDWPTQEAQLLAEHADLRVARRQADGLVLESPKAEGQFEIDLWVHHLQTGGLSARRPAQGEILAQLPAHERLHLWVTVRDADGGHAHHEVLCDTTRLRTLLHAWRTPMAATPAQCRLPPSAPQAVAELPEGTSLPVEDPADLSLLAGLKDGDAASAQAQLRADLARLDMQRVAQHWPRDARGRPAAKTTALLAAYGPPVTVLRRQPCLLITSAGVRDMPRWRLQLSAEFRENHRHQWDAAPWLWARDTPAPNAHQQEEQARALIAQGYLSEACPLFDVALGDGVLRLAAGLPLTRFAMARPDWADALRVGLQQLAPWHLAGGLARIQARLEAANRKPPRPGSWSRKLFWLPGQRSASRLGLGVRQGAHGGPLLDVIDTASNALFPAPDWQDMGKH